MKSPAGDGRRGFLLGGPPAAEAVARAARLRPRSCSPEDDIEPRLQGMNACMACSVQSEHGFATGLVRSLSMPIGASAGSAARIIRGEYARSTRRCRFCSS
jgi:hypothetical protein